MNNHFKQPIDPSHYFPPLEPIERDEEKRDAFLPIRYEHIFKIYKRMEANFWTDEDIDKDAEKDCRDREAFSSEERRAFDYIQSFFAVSDFVVNDAIGEKLLTRIKSTDVRVVYQFITMMENIHMITYSKIIDKAVKDPKERKRLLTSATEIPTIKRKVDWIRKYMGRENDIHDLERDTIKGLIEMSNLVDRSLQAVHPDEDISKYKSPELLQVQMKLRQKMASLDRLLIVLGITEGIFFQGSFALIYWFAKQGKVPGASKGNEKIAEDEGQHVEYGSTIHNTLIVHKESENVVHQMVREAVEIESDFIQDAIPKPMRGMNATLMIRYIKYAADWFLQTFGYTKIYHIKSEDIFDFMRKQSISVRNSDFFKTEEVTYKRHGENETAEDRQIHFDSSTEESE